MNKRREWSPGGPWDKRPLVNVVGGGLRGPLLPILRHAVFFGGGLGVVAMLAAPPGNLFRGWKGTQGALWSPGPAALRGAAL